MQLEELDDRVRRLLVGNDRKLCPLVVGQRRVGALSTALDTGHAAEVLLDLCLDGRGIDVADDDHSHEVGAVPIAVEAPRGIVRKALEHVDLANR